MRSIYYKTLSSLWSTNCILF